MGGTKRAWRDDGGQRRNLLLLRGGWLVGVYLCWGLVLTVLVAWGVAWNGLVHDDREMLRAVDFDRFPSRYSEFSNTAGVTVVMCLHEISKEDLASVREEGQYLLKHPWFAPHLQPLYAEHLGRRTFATIAAGWPWRALAVEIVQTDDPATPKVRGFPEGCMVRGGWHTPQIARRYRGLLGGDALYLPLLPLWRGLIANTLFYALGVWLLRRGLVMARGWRRRRRGRCGWRGGCGYDLRGSVGEVCPECGRPVGDVARGGVVEAAVE